MQLMGVFLLVLIFNVTGAWAQMAGKPAAKPIPTIPVTVQQGSAATQISNYPGQKTRKHEARISHHFGLNNYTLDAGGFNADVSSMNMSANEIRYIYKKSEKVDYFFNLYQSTSDLKIPSSLTPRSGDMEVTKYNLGLNCYPGMEHEKYKNIYFGASIDLRDRNSVVTTPNPLIVDSRIIGFRLHAGFLNRIDDDFSYQVELGFMLPYKFKEYGEKTGSFQSSFYTDVSVMFLYKVNHFIKAASGLVASYDRTNFSGTSDRGSIDAEETYLNYSIPLELRFEF